MIGSEVRQGGEAPGHEDFAFISGGMGACEVLIRGVIRADFLVKRSLQGTQVEAWRPGRRLLQ